MNREASVEKFRMRLQKLWNVVKSSQSNEGFIRNVLDRLLPFLQEDPMTKSLIGDWNTSLSKEALVLYHVYKELSWAVEEIRKCSQDDPSALEYLDQVLEDVRKDGSCAFLKEIPYPYDISYYRLKALYVNKVSKTLDLTFAPFTFSLIKSLNPTYISARNDTDPRHLWSQLLSLRDFWSHTNGLMDARWPRIEIEGLDLWLRADHVRRQAFFRMVAGKLLQVDLPNHDKDYFDREYFHKLIERLADELLLLICKDIPVIVEEYADEEGEGSQWRTVRNQQNKAKLKPHAIKHWKQQIIEGGQDPKKVTNGSIAKLLKAYASKNELGLKDPTDNLYLEISAETSPRLYKEGKYVGLKPGFR